MIRPSRLVPTLLALAVALTLALTSCMGIPQPAGPFDNLHPLADEGTGGGSGPADEPSAADQDFPFATPDDGCRPNWPHRLQLTVTDPEEIPYLKLVAVCADAAGTEVVAVNNSNGVWAFGDTNHGRFLQVAGGVTATTFRQLAQAALYPYAFIAPTEVVLLPSERDGLSWIIHPSLSLSWIAHEQLVHIVSATGKAAIMEAFSLGTAKRNAMGMCAAEVFAESEGEGILQGAGAKQHLLDGLGISTNGGDCADAWHLAEVQLGTTTFPTWSGDVVGLVTAPESAAEIDQRVDWLVTAVQDVERVCRLLPSSC